MKNLSGWAVHVVSPVLQSTPSLVQPCCYWSTWCAFFGWGPEDM